MSESDPNHVEEPDSDYTRVAVPDEQLPEDLKRGEENPLAESADDDAERQDLGDPHIPGLERDSADKLSLPEADDDDPTGES